MKKKYIPYAVLGILLIVLLVTTIVLPFWKGLGLLALSALSITTGWYGRKEYENRVSPKEEA